MFGKDKEPWYGDRDKDWLDSALRFQNAINAGKRALYTHIAVCLAVVCVAVLFGVLLVAPIDVESTRVVQDAEGQNIYAPYSNGNVYGDGDGDADGTAYYNYPNKNKKGSSVPKITGD